MTNHNRDWQEMPRMCKLVSTGPSAAPIYVNPTNVRYVRPTASGCTLHFDNDQTLGVATSVDQAIAALDDAMNDDRR